MMKSFLTQNIKELNKEGNFEHYFYVNLNPNHSTIKITLYDKSILSILNQIIVRICMFRNS